MSKQTPISSSSRKTFPWKIIAVTIIVIAIVALLAAVWYVQSAKEKQWRYILDLTVQYNDTNGRGPHYVTDAFLVTGDEWRIIWSVHGEWDTFRIRVVDAYTENVIREITATSALDGTNVEDIDYLNVRGRYELDFNVTSAATAYSWSWMAYVDEYR